jgi:protein lifeguard
MATLTTFYTKEAVMAAGVMTLLLTVTLSLFACFTKKDYTKILSALPYIFLAAFIGFVIFIIIMPNEYIMLIFCCVFLVIMGLFLIWDTQLIIGGRRYQIGIDDYVLAVLLLYTDVIMIFYYLLKIIGTRI